MGVGLRGSQRGRGHRVRRLSDGRDVPGGLDVGTLLRPPPTPHGPSVATRAACAGPWPPAHAWRKHTPTTPKPVP